MRTALAAKFLLSMKRNSVGLSLPRLTIKDISRSWRRLPTLGSTVSLLCDLWKSTACLLYTSEMVVHHFVNQLETDQSLDCHLIVCNLYKTFLSICDDMDITDAIPDMEEADGSAYLLEQLNSAIGNGEFIDKIQYEPHEDVYKRQISH